MPKAYYTYQISVANREIVQVEKWDSQNQLLGQPCGRFRYQNQLTEEINELLQITCKNELNDSSKSRLLGEVLFDALFDDVLRQDFVNFYYDVVQQKKQLLRIELDIDEQSMPEVAALPWEFMCLPQRANLGTIWLGTAPDLVFSRRRSQWIPAQPIQLNKNEKLRIALVVSTPSDLGSVEYQKVQAALEKLAAEQAERIELLPIVASANPEAVDTVLAQKPHIFHFIGHGRLHNDHNQEVGQIAFVDDLGYAMWIDADYFSGLLNRHRPGIVMLQACEGGMLSASQAFVGVASRVVQQNIPVVVAMQYEVSNITASRFACCFYQKLTQGEPVDIAVQEGRYAIALSSMQYRKRDFATPVIFMRVRNGHLFKWKRQQKSNTKKLGKPIVTNKLIPLNREFINLQEHEKFEHILTNSSQVKPPNDCESLELKQPQTLELSKYLNQRPDTKPPTNDIRENWNKISTDEDRPTSNPVLRPTVALSTNILSSNKAVDYTKLEQLLVSRKWQEADRETKIVMLRVADQENRDFLSENDIKLFPCTDLQTIDLLWEKYSDGHFGFSVQRRIWRSRKINQNLQEFGRYVEWSKNNDWLRYEDLSFRLEEDVPWGHLPVVGSGDNVGEKKFDLELSWTRFLKLFLVNLFSRLENCGF